MLPDDDNEVVSLLAELAKTHWEETRQPYELSVAGEVLVARGLREKESIGRLKKFILRTQEKGLFRLFQDPTALGRVGIVPAGVEVDEILPWRPATHRRRGRRGKKKKEIRPVSGIPSALGYKWSAHGKITLESSSANIPRLPFPSSQRDHRLRLEASRVMASDLAQHLQKNKINVREEYALELGRYQSRLPSDEGNGNIILADASARLLRSMFAAEAAILPAPFASSLKILLEQHVGLRAFYPELEVFYRDVRSGTLQEPLPLDAVGGVVDVVVANTPDLFDPSVGAAIDQSTGVPAPIMPTEEMEPRNEDPTPPPDPLGELDPHAASDFQTAGIINSLWEVFLHGEDITDSPDIWSSTHDALAPHIRRVVRWIREFLPNSGRAK